MRDERLTEIVTREGWRWPDLALHADTTWERSATYTFAEQMTPWLESRGLSVMTVNDGQQAIQATTAKTDCAFFTQYEKGAVGPHGDVIVPAFTAGTMSNVNGQLRRQCTQRWKVVPQQRYISAYLAERKISKKLGVVQKWLGISLDEFERMRPSDVKYVQHCYPLVEMRMTRADCVQWLQSHDLPVPMKSSCVFCPYHNARAWREMKREDGRDWQIACEVDAVIRDKRPPYPLYVHSARVPLPEAVQIPADYGMDQTELWSVEEAAICDSGACFL
jgi:hypothetical protein